MSTAHTMNQKYTMVVKGAVDVLLTRMSHICIGSEIRKITDEDRQTIEKQNLEFSRDGPVLSLIHIYKRNDRYRTYKMGNPWITFRCECASAF